ncbi:nickel transporter [Dechloromonas denitrificans]|uniref:HoxN/HupN/NixA family nickel/cobalt transporter n=1 Tax=Dechloromonas denitrificans TaxID=281362 RepID=UPI001CF8FDCF|nr:nickel transporter [Dechloromonas denitrificans]UCV03487.1 nickel transporter [Dechloromonas denitrificans]UCV07747.1 nickel transporter [Dechloromonas denitrificans]
METLPSDWLSLLILTFVLGMKHGFDADHLATIDGLTRYNARSRPGLARYCGTLFSLGHGAVVMAIALGVSAIAGQWTVPEWFAVLGSVISIAFLVALGSLNLAAVLRAGPDEMVQPLGLKGRLLGKLRHVSHPALVALVGALFALSFDTLSQAAFFALTATQFGGWQHALLLALLFMLGMLLTDGINGLWIARLIARADQVALVASRVMGLVVSGISLLVAAFGAAKLLSPGINAWSDGKELIFGFALVAIIAASFVVAVRLTRRPAVA